MKRAWITLLPIPAGLSRVRRLVRPVFIAASEVDPSKAYQISPDVVRASALCTSCSGLVDLVKSQLVV